MSKAARLSSKEIKEKLLDLGVDAKISGIRLEHQEEILMAVELFRKKFQELVNSGIVIREANPLELIPKGQTLKSWVSSMHYERQHGKLIAVVLLNPIWFRDKDLNKYLKMKFEQGYACSFNVVGVICHELGHVLWLQLLTKNIGISIGNNIKPSQLSDLDRDWRNSQFVGQICIDTCLKLQIKNTKTVIESELSEYGGAKPSETFSESIVEYCMNLNPRIFAKTIIAEYHVYARHYYK